MTTARALEIYNAVTGVAHALESANAGLENANRRVRQLEAEVTSLQQAVKSANDDADMYAKAWQRELGRFMPAKTHRIDACVVGTRRLVEGANKAEAYAAAVDRWRTEAAIARTLGIPEPHLDEYLPATAP